MFNLREEFVRYYIPIYDNGWKFNYVLSKNKIVHHSDLLVMDNHPLFQYWFDKYSANLKDSEFYEHSPVFHIYWLTTLLDYSSMEYAEAKRLAYLELNPKKHKQSETVHEQAHQEFFKSLIEVKS